MFPVASDNHLTADQMAVRNEVDPGAPAAVRMVVSGDVDAVTAVELQHAAIDVLAATAAMYRSQKLARGGTRRSLLSLA
jgi:hypothetical protein